MSETTDIISYDSYDRNIFAIYSKKPLKIKKIYYSSKYNLSFIPIIEIQYSDTFKYLSKLNNKEM